MLTRLNVLGTIKAMVSANVADLLKNFIAIDDTFPKGGLPTTKYFSSVFGL